MLAANDDGPATGLYPLQSTGLCLTHHALLVGNPDEALRQRLLEYVFFPFNDDPALTMERLIQCQMNAAMLRGRCCFCGERTPDSSISRQSSPTSGEGWRANGWPMAREAVQAVDWGSTNVRVYVGADICSARDRSRIATGRIDRVVTPGQALAFEWFGMVWICWAVALVS